MDTKKKILVIVLALGALGGLYYVYNKKSKTALGSLNTDAGTGSSVIPTLSTQTVDTPEVATFKNLLSILQADPVFKTKAFPTTFIPAVQTDNDLRKAGKPAQYNNGDAYKTGGLPAAFMGVADAWQSAIGFNEDTHTKLWNVFSAYKAQVDASAITA